MMPYYGKYRGVVSNNRDPDSIGRIKARVPDITGERETGWALPALPYAGKGVGLFLLPPIGANVWIEFEGGDTEIPIWTGCFWGENDNPPAVEPEKKVLKTDVATITLDDGGKSVTIETTAGMKITIDTTGIEISTGGTGNVKVTSAQVSINSGALEVT